MRIRRRQEDATARSPRLFLRVLLSVLLALLIILPFGGEALAGEARVALLSDAFSPDYTGRAQLISGLLARHDVKTTTLSGADLSDEKLFNSRRFDCLVLPDARYFPALAVGNVLAFLRSGGDLVVIGGPLFEKLLYSAQGRWHTSNDILATIRPEKTVVDFSRLKSEAWQHNTSNPEVNSRFRLRGGVKGERGTWAEYRCESVPAWDTYRLALPKGIFPKEHSIVCFRACGDKNTTSLSLEVQEEDGSRWIAVVPLEEAVREYALGVEEFKFWADGAPPGRGGRNDRLNLARARLLVVGLARSHNVLPQGPLSFRLSSIGSARPPVLAEPASIPVLETLYPWYKTYRTNAIVRIAADFGWPFPLPMMKVAEAEVVCPFWRGRGLGAANRSPYRWIPILNGYDGKERFRGTVASLTLNYDGQFANSHWLQIGLWDLPVISELGDNLGVLMADAIQKMHRNIFFRCGGADRASYFEGHEITIGWTLNSSPPASYEVMVTVSNAEGARKYAPTFSRSVRLSGDTSGRLSWKPQTGEDPRYWVAIALRDNRGEVMDMINHEFTVLEAHPGTSEQIVKVEGSNFVLKGKRWYPHGMNYWPSNWGGRESNEFWGHWLSPAMYDPVVVERDLAFAKGLGMNSLSIQLNGPDQAPAVNDFLFRCRRHGIYVNLFLSGGHPLQPNVRLLTNLLSEGRFAGNPAIWGYDIAWEPHIGEEGQRRRYDADWSQWIEEQYGSIESAEKDWKFELRKENGGITTPSRNQILTSGPGNVMVAVYRRFLDDLISRGYRRVTAAIREVDPTHLIGVRTGYGGTGEMGIDPRMPFDLLSGAKHLDLISPEGYGLPPNWESARTRGFTTLYGRYAGNGKPVFWAEFGQSVHPSYGEAAFTRQKNIYENMYRLVLDSFAQGSAGWWFPGGYRLGEHSDYGIFSPDMAPRASAETLARFAPLVTGQGAMPEPDAWITIDRDLHPRGYSQIRRRHEEEYLKLRKQGKAVALRTAATGTTSANVPDAAVGNVPYTGANPHKYLNAEFNGVRLQVGDGDWIEIHKGREVTVPRGQPVQLRVSVGNTGEPTWLAPRRTPISKGDVFLLCEVEGRSAMRFPIPKNTARYEDIELPNVAIPALRDAARICLRMQAVQKASFGEKFTFTVSPE